MIGAGSYFETAPECPTDGDAYPFTATTYPNIGALAAACPIQTDATVTDHVPDADDLVSW